MTDRAIKKIIVHCSASGFGDAATIDRWHRERGWECIGYHYVFLNGYRLPRIEYDPSCDGLLEYGRPVGMMGAHCKGHNADSIGICLIGDKGFTKNQRVALAQFVKRLLKMFGLTPSDVYGHYEFEPGKTCPNIDMAVLRAALDAEHPVEEFYKMIGLPEAAKG